MRKENNNTNGKNRSYYLNLKARYLNAAKEAQSSGESYLSEHNLQYAEHYTRVIAERFNNPIRKKKIGDSKEFQNNTENQEEYPEEKSTDC
jgi:hypothetical protein